MALPLEIRANIYEYVFVGTTRITTDNYAGRTHEAARIKWGIDTALLTVSKDVRFEAKQFLYNTHCFSIGTGGLDFSVMSLPNKLGPANVQRVRHLEIRLDDSLGPDFLGPLDNRPPFLSGQTALESLQVISSLRTVTLTLVDFDLSLRFRQGEEDQWDRLDEIVLGKAMEYANRKLQVSLPGNDIAVRLPTVQVHLLVTFHWRGLSHITVS